MIYVQLGNSDLKVSKVCLGCMGFGEALQGMHTWTLPYEESKKIIKYALDQGISAKEHIETCLNNSLKRLQMDYVDLYILHAWDNYTPIEETLEALNDVVQQGKVGYIRRVI